MKCELCHKGKAETVLSRKDGEELYVCNACAKAERVKAQKQRAKTRVDSGEVPPVVGALINAFDELFETIGQVAESAKEKPAKVEQPVEFPLSRIPAEFRIVGRLHLEGLFLIGELEAVKRAVKALNMDLQGATADGVNDAGHAYALNYNGSSELAKRVVSDLLREERNARVRLYEEMPRVFGDSLCRALAILKNCRLLSQGELFDLLSPLRLAAKEKLLDGITFAAIEKLMGSLELTDAIEIEDPRAKDLEDAKRADAMNRYFENVMLNELAEEKFL